MKFQEWFTKRQLNEGATRYSVEVNYRTKTQEVLENFSKIALGYVSAGLKKHGYHVKQIFDEKPIRIFVSSRNWDDGEWVVMVSYNSKEEGGCFIISNGFYNKDRQTLSVQKSEKCKSSSPSEIVKDVINMMHHLKDKPDRQKEKLNPIKLKRGPKR